MLAVEEASYTIGSTADQTAKRTSMANKLEGSPLIIEASTVITNPSTGFGTQGFLVLQLEIINSVPAGESPVQTQTYRYAET